MIRIIVLGPQCSGKTTIAQDLRKLGLTCQSIDEDEEINRRNGGKSPSDSSGWEYKWTVLRPAIHKDTLEMDDVIFFTSFFDPALLMKAKQEKFMIIQLTTSEEVLKKRNRKRMQTQKADDATHGWAINMPYHADIRTRGLADIIIDSNSPVRELSELILVACRLGRLTPHIMPMLTQQVV